MSAVAVDRSEVLVLRVRSAFSHFLCLRQVRCGVNCGVACRVGSPEGSTEKTALGRCRAEASCLVR